MCGNLRILAHARAASLAFSSERTVGNQAHQNEFASLYNVDEFKGGFGSPSLGFQDSRHATFVSSKLLVDSNLRVVAGAFTG